MVLFLGNLAEMTMVLCDRRLGSGGWCPLSMSMVLAVVPKSAGWRPTLDVCRGDVFQTSSFCNSKRMLFGVGADLDGRQGNVVTTRYKKMFYTRTFSSHSSP